MHYSKINPCDLANGEGIRVSLFVSGCKFKCDGCFNPEAQDFEYGSVYTQETENRILSLIDNPNVDGLSILGGDPLWQDFFDIINLTILCNKVHELGKTVWIWSGYTWESLFNDEQIDFRQVLVETCDVFVDGQFQADKKDLSLAWRGSSNQRVIDVQKTKETGEIVCYLK